MELEQPLAQTAASREALLVTVGRGGVGRNLGRFAPPGQAPQPSPGPTRNIVASRDTDPSLNPLSSTSSTFNAGT